MALGQCNCGEVSFSIAAELSDVFVCHCSICRRATGSNGIAVVLVNNDDFEWTGGQSLVRTWRKPEADWHMPFCTSCGSPVPGPSDDSNMFVPAGLISDAAEPLRVAHHIWVGSKADWDEIGDDGQQHKEGFRG